MPNTKLEFHNILNVCLMQLAPQKKDKSSIPTSFLKLLKKIPKNVDWIVLPEMWRTSFYNQDPKAELKETKEALKFLKVYAKKNRVNFSGSHLVKKGNFYTNTAFLINIQGEIQALYSKLHLFKMGEEHKKFISGSGYKVFSSIYGKFGFAICYDIRFPEFIRSLVLKGARFLIIPSAWPRERLDHYLTLLRARAIENQCYVISCNKVGKNEKGIINGGHSVVFDPWGTKLLELGSSESFGVVSIDLNRVEEVRNAFPVLQCRRGDLY
ncbi:MAG: carbon-nitrogen family hydrolase [Deltaproteobacteria bacterium]|nr:carbon-nitrogen family hydrolase [Deltaproteobacteria bacterium]